MKTTVEFVDAVKRRLSLPSDYAFSKELSLSPQAVSRYRHGKDFFGEETALKVAALLDLPPAYVLACVAAERAHSAEVKRAWVAASRRLIAVVLVGFFGLGGTLYTPAPRAADAEQCILC